MAAAQIFAGNPLDRGERERRDEDWIRRAALGDEARFLLLWKLQAPLSAGRDVQPGRGQAAQTWLGWDWRRNPSCWDSWTVWPTLPPTSPPWTTQPAP